MRQLLAKSAQKGQTLLTTTSNSHPLQENAGNCIGQPHAIDGQEKLEALIVHFPCVHLEYDGYSRLLIVNYAAMRWETGLVARGLPC
jgi:hypothetical protein